MSDRPEARHVPGGKVRLPLLGGMKGDARFSSCGQYRHWLSRCWDRHGPWVSPYALWIGMNPSTAEADIDDPTIRRELRFTAKMGLHCYFKCNVMDYRATSPAALLAPGVKPCSDGNMEYIRSLASNASVIIAAWGSIAKPLRNFATAAALMLSNRDLMCMGMTKDGSPRHPLYLPYNAQMILWRRKTCRE